MLPDQPAALRAIIEALKLIEQVLDDLRADVDQLRVEVASLRAERTGPPRTLEELERSLGGKP